MTAITPSAPGPAQVQTHLEWFARGTWPKWTRKKCSSVHQSNAPVPTGAHPNWPVPSGPCLGGPHPDEPNPELVQAWDSYHQTQEQGHVVISQKSQKLSMNPTLVKSSWLPQACLWAKKYACKDCPYGQAGKLGFHKNMKIIWKKYDQEYDKNMTFGSRIWVPSPKM